MNKPLPTTVFKKEISFGTYCLIFYLIFSFLLAPIWNKGSSMEPTIKDGSFAIGNRLAYVKHSPKRGDIIAFEHNDKNGYGYSKRVIGLPGDKITFHDGYVYINDELYDESAYLGDDVETNCTKEFEVPKESVFVLGDNREDSTDSRDFQNPYISYKEIKAKQIFYWRSSSTFVLPYDSEKKSLPVKMETAKSDSNHKGMIPKSEIIETMLQPRTSSLTASLSQGQWGRTTARVDNTYGLLDVSLDHVYTGKDAKELIKKLGGRKSVPTEGTAFEVAEFSTDASLENAYMDVRLYGMSGGRLEINGSSYTTRTYDLESQEESSDMKLIYKKHYVYYEVPIGCDEYLLDFGSHITADTKLTNILEKNQAYFIVKAK